MPNAKLQPLENGDERSAARIRLLIEASQEVRSNTSAISVQNVSTTGLMLESGRALPSGSLITVDLLGVGFKQVRVVWNNDRRQGVEFLQPLSPSQLKAVRRQSKVVWPNFTQNPLATHRRDVGQGEVAGDGETVNQSVKSILAPGLKLQIVTLLSGSIWALILLAT